MQVFCLIYSKESLSISTTLRQRTAIIYVGYCNSVLVGRIAGKLDQDDAGLKSTAGWSSTTGVFWEGHAF